MSDLDNAREQARRWREYAKGNGRTRKGRALTRAARAMADLWDREVARLASPTQTASNAGTLTWAVQCYTTKDAASDGAA
jgi:hypothetical protein